jgi:regulator of sirC expression with transglutaminase-like and TPR domain
MDLQQALARLGREPAAPFDLAELALELARDEYPQLDVEAYLSELDGLAHEVRPRLSGSLAARVRAFTRFLFHDLGFRGDQRDYYDPRNSYLNDVMDRRTGLPIALSAVAMAVGARAGLEVVGVGLPGHFIVKAVARDGDGPDEGPREILFDPFHEGRVLNPEQCEALVEEVVGTPFLASPEALAPMPLGSIVQRMLNNLKGVYLSQGDFVRGARVIVRLAQLCPNDVLQRRDLGACLLHAGQPGAAIDHLAAYMRSVPVDAEDVVRLLNQAKAMLARWN